MIWTKSSDAELYLHLNPSLFVRVSVRVPFQVLFLLLFQMLLLLLFQVLLLMLESILLLFQKVSVLKCPSMVALPLALFNSVPQLWQKRQEAGQPVQLLRVPGL
jgi:hypothetical protein